MPGRPHNTSLPLLLITLIAGLALGWLLHDLAPRTSAPLAIAPSATSLPPPAPVWTATAAVIPTEKPTADLPTATSLPATATSHPSIPTATPEPPTATATPEPPTAAPATRVIGYAAYTVTQGETLEQIAELGGSKPELIVDYNRLAGVPQPGRALIVPQLSGRTSQLLNDPTLIVRGPSARPWVALTLDAGASAAPTPRMLETLRQRGIRITFFLTGKWIRENPDLARQIVADGHEVANHTYSHPDLTQLDDEALQRELADTDAAMNEVAGVDTRPFFRPPFGAYDERVLQRVQSEGYLPIYWTLDSLDSVGEPKTAEFLVERVTTKLSPEQLRGAIILAHCGSDATADALPTILDRFAAMGLEVKTISEVLGDGSS